MTRWPPPVQRLSPWRDEPSGPSPNPRDQSPRSASCGAACKPLGAGSFWENAMIVPPVRVLFSALCVTVFVAVGVATAAESACDDATFLRRVSLDLIGRVPTVDEQLAFAESRDRSALVDELLDNPEHPLFWSQLWSTLLVGRFPGQQTDRELLRRWLEDSLAKEVPLNHLAFELISASGISSLHGPVNYLLGNREDQVLRLGRAFLGVQLDCAKCHDHPTDRWTNDDYIALERFFRPVRFREVPGGVEVSDNVPRESGHELPRFLTGREAVTAAWRRELAMMVIQCKPFSRSMVRRVWHWTMGSSLSGGVDSVQRESHPAEFEWLEQLSARLVEQGFQLKGLLREICLSPGYQAVVSDSRERGTGASGLHPHRSVRRMLPEQWIASVRVVARQSPLSGAELSEQTRRLMGQAQSSLSSDPFEWTPTSQQTLRSLSGEIPNGGESLGGVFQRALGRPPLRSDATLFGDMMPEQVAFVLIQSNEFLLND